VSNVRIIFAGGGTGGHLFPALAIADEIRRINPDVDILFIGTRGRIEARVVPQSGYKFRTIWISGFTRSLKLRNFIFPLKLTVALIQSFFIIRKFRPDVAVGTGGFVSGPVLYVATLLKIPTLIQDHNSYPGITTRLLSSRVNEVHIAFESSRKYFKWRKWRFLATQRRSRQDNLKLSGSPVRRLATVNKNDALRYFNLDLNKKTLFVTGGSQGAASINSSLLKVLGDIVGHGIQIIWQTGTADYNRIKSECARFGSLIWVSKFIDKIEYAYFACDLALCRAGATTIAELTQCGVAAVLVPYPYAAANHQVENAKAMIETGAAEMIPDSELDVKLKDTVIRLMSDDEKRKMMSRRSRELGKPDAALNIAQSVLQLAARSDLRKIKEGQQH